MNYSEDFMDPVSARSLVLKPYTPVGFDDIMETGKSGQESSPTFGQLDSICGTSHGGLSPGPFVQDPASGSKSFVYAAPIGPLTYDTPEIGEAVYQFCPPILSAAEQWDLEGFFQVVYALSAFAFPPDTTPWETYSPLIIHAFFEAAEDEDQLFTDNVLTIAFQNCSDVFATFYEWPEHTKAEVFAHHSTGEAALAAILQLVKLARGFGIDGEEWWELRRSLWIAFAQPFQRNGWVSENSNIFHKLFTLSLQIFLNLGIKPGTWTFTIISSLNAWRKVKEIQEATAAERILVALGKRIKVESAWETLRMSIDGDTENTPQYSHDMQSYDVSRFGPNFENDSTSNMSPGSRLREHERMKPLLNLQQRLAPSIPAHYLSPSALSGGPLSSSSVSTPSRIYSYGNSSTSRGNIEDNSPMEKAHAAITPASSFFFSIAAFSPESSSLVGDITDPGFGDLLDLSFEDIAIAEPMDLDDNGMFSGAGAFEDEGFESQQAEVSKCYRGSHAEIVGEALRWSGKQLWEMTDEEFHAFCSQPPPWE